MRRLLPGSLVGIVSFALLAMATADTAVAYFTTTGGGDSAPIVVSQIVKPTITAATPASGGTVALTWGAVTAPGTGTVIYTISRNGGKANGTCSSSTTGVSCTDSGLEPGTYTYVVSAKWRTWSATSSTRAATVTVGPADHLVIGAASLTPTAGAADNLTITAQDAKGSTVTSYTGSHSLTFSGAPASPSGTTATVTDSSGGAVNFGSATGLTFSAGVASVSSTTNGVMKLYKSGSTSLSVTDGTLLTPTPLVLTVAAAAAAKFTLSAAVTTLAAGGSSNLTITALDTYGNVATAYTGPHNLTFSGAAAIGTSKPTVSNSSGTAVAFGTATAISFAAGVAAVASSKNGAMTLYKAESPSISVSDGSISAETPVEVTVSPLAASKFVLTAASATPAAGEADNLTITAQDSYGNIATAYTGSHSLTYSTASASPTGVLPTVSNSAGADIAFGSATATSFNAGVATVTGTKNGAMKLYNTGSTNLKATDGTLLTSTALVVTVAPGTAVKFNFSASATSLVASGSSNLTTTVQDSYGNTVTTYTGSHNLTYSGASASPNSTAPTVASSTGTATPFGTATAITFTSGVASVTTSKNGLLKLYKAESPNISVSDGTISSAASIAFTVTPGAASKWALTNISVSAGSLGSTCLFTCTVTKLGNSGTVNAKVAVADTYGNIVSALGSGHSANVTVTSGTGTISGSPLAIPATGAAESATTFTFTSRSSGPFTETITAAAQEGTAYTAATLTANK
jgi:hypothetical protein